MESPLVVVASEADPVARAVVDRWGSLPSTGEFLDGAPLRTLGSGVFVLKRAVLHLHDDRLERRLPGVLARARPTLLFPSIHRSEQGVASLTVHPLGNPTSEAPLGGEPRTFVPTDPPRMAAAVRALRGWGREHGWPASFESTHHGPASDAPAFFLEIGFDGPSPPHDAVGCLAETIPRLASVSDRDRVALGVGGGHYAPRFTDLVIRRSWAFGHLLSRHVLPAVSATEAVSAYRATPGAEGIVYARAEDARTSAFAEVGPPLREQDAPRRGERFPEGSTLSGPPASGT